MGLDDYNAPGGKLRGNDASHAHLKTINAYMYIMQYNTGKFVIFKPYLTTFKLNCALKHKDETSASGQLKSAVMEESKFSYTLSFDAVSHSVSEAQANEEKYHMLNRMLRYTLMHGNKTGVSISQSNPFYILFTNLINNGSKGWIGGYAEKDIKPRFIRKRGVRGNIIGIQRTIDTSMGYFEYNKKLYPKSFNISFTFKVLRVTMITAKGESPMLQTALFAPASNSGSIRKYKPKSPSDLWLYGSGEYDEGRWPFAVDAIRSSRIKFSSNLITSNYRNNKHAVLKVSYVDPTGRQRGSVSFDAFIESFDQEFGVKVQTRSFSYDDRDMPLTVTWPKAKLVLNIPFEDANDAHANMQKVLYLIRYFVLPTKDPNAAEGEAKKNNNRCHYSLTNHLNGKYITNNFDIEFDIEQGFYVKKDFWVGRKKKKLIKDRRIYPKSVKLSFDLALEDILSLPNAL